MTDAISRKDWEQRFGALFCEAPKEGPEELKWVVAAELGAWPEEEIDWLDFTSEDAADENLSCWDE